MTDNAIEIESVSKKFGRNPVLQEVNLTVPRGSAESAITPHPPG